MINAKITALGHYQPERIIDNQYIANIYEEKGWLGKNEDGSPKTKKDIENKAERNGFFYRRREGEKGDTRTMAINSVKDIVDKYGKDMIKNLDAIRVGTLTPGYLFPSISSLVAKDIMDIFGVKFKGAARDVSNACPSGLNAIIDIDPAIQCGKIEKALIIGSDKMTSIIDGFDRDSFLLFGDAAGAVILESNKIKKIGIQGSLERTFAQDFEDVYYKTGLSVKDNGQIEKFVMNGENVYKHGVDHVIEMVKEYIKTNKLNIHDFDYIIPHQANIRMLNDIGNGLNFDNAKILKTLHENGNTAAASPFLTLSKHKDILKPGDRILMLSLGAGFSVALVDLIWSLDK